ncbi:glycosyltransferase [Methylocystis parvus]|nr:glycosyltransferase [Methylocystis parvus]WBK01842.1 glycosyltransferase [Methylocystis parvus OBBP]
MTRAAREFTTWYVEEPRDFDGPPFLHIEADSSGVTVVSPLLPKEFDQRQRNAAVKIMLARLISQIRPQRLIAWYYTPMALQFTEALEPDRCVYDNMDELSAFAGAPNGIAQMERRLMSRCHVVYVGGHSLYEAKRKRHGNIHVFPSSVDSAHFRQARFVESEAADQSSIPHPRIGFFGVIDERMDLKLVAELAALRPEWHLVMIGPTAKIDPETLPRAANIHWLGCKDYASLPRYLAGWDVGFMPFAINDATRYISPTKTPEFLAAGVPLVSTPIKDVVRPYGERGDVEIAADANSFAGKIDFLLHRPRSPWLASVDAHLSRMSWDETWAGMRQHLDVVTPDNSEMAEARSV